MKILIITGIFPPDIGGPATFAALFSRELVAAGNSVHVVTYAILGNQYATKNQRDQDYPFSVYKIIRKGKLSNYIRMLWYLLKTIRHYDVVYTLDWFSAGVPLYLASILTGKRYFVRIGGGYLWEKYLSEGKPPLTLRQFYEKGLQKTYPLMFFLIGVVVRRAKGVIFNSKIQADMYTRYYGLSKQNVSVIPNPIDVVKMTLSRQTPTREIVFAGRFIVMKNVSSLLKAFARLPGASYSLLLIGEGPEEKRLRSLATELGIEKRITWNQPLARSELYNRIINCAYVVIPSWTDVSPNQVWECLALGIPFLLTQENYLPISSSPMMTVDPASIDDIAHTMELLSGPDAYAELVKEQRGIQFNYSYAKSVAAHMDIFKKP